MTTLQCNVESCASNKNGCCCRPSIQVNGYSAHVSSETCCHSFVEKHNEMSNSIHFDSPNDALEISCSAFHCVFNEQEKCHAECICIDGCHASCDSGTECSSFQEK